MKNCHGVQTNEVANAKNRQRMAFISYSEEDKDVARTLCEKLEGADIPVWYAERDIEPGAFIPVAITEAIRKCGVFIVIFSKSGVKSPYLLDEIQYVLKCLPGEPDAVFPLPIAIDPDGKSVLSKQTLDSLLWFDATVPPLETRLNEFVRLVQELEQSPMTARMERRPT